jgi:hypothetical protein
MVPKPISYSLFCSCLWLSPLSLLLGSCSLFGTEGDPIEKDNPVTPELLRHVAEVVEKYRGQVETLRALPFKRPVHSTVVTRDFYRQETSKEIEAGISDSLSRSISRELSQFGFFPDTTLRYKDLFKTFSGGFAVGYYREGSDSVFVLADYAYDETNLREILTHELAHALQDQYGRLDRLALPDSQLAPYRSDASWYQTCLIEGEAYFTAALAAATFTYPQPDPKANAVLVVRNNRANAFQRWKQTARPHNLFLPSWAAYEFGPALVGEAYDSKGWDSLETLYANAFQPSYSAITANRIPWVAMDLQPFMEVIDTTKAYCDLGSHGSIGLLSLVNQSMDSADFFSGLHWRTDTYLYNHKPGKQWGQLLWSGVFVDSLSAMRTRELLISLLKNRFQGGNYPETVLTGNSWLENGSGYQIQGSGLTTYLLQSGNQVMWIEGFTDSESLRIFALLQVDHEKRVTLEKEGPKRVRTPTETVFINGRGRIYQDLLSLRH